MIRNRFQHDCDACQSYGWINFEGLIYDIYECPQRGMTTVIARFSDKGPDYYSLPRMILDSMKEDYVLVKAKNRIDDIKANKGMIFDDTYWTHEEIKASPTLQKRIDDAYNGRR